MAQWGIFKQFFKKISWFLKIHLAVHGISAVVTQGKISKYSPQIYEMNLIFSGGWGHTTTNFYC